MRYKDITSALSYRADKIADNVVAVVIIDAKPVFDGYWQLDGLVHRGNAVTNKLGLTHQAGTKGTVLNAI